MDRLVKLRLLGLLHSNLLSKFCHLLPFPDLHWSHYTTQRCEARGKKPFGSIYDSKCTWMDYNLISDFHSHVVHTNGLSCLAEKRLHVDQESLRTKQVRFKRDLPLCRQSAFQNLPFEVLGLLHASASENLHVRFAYDVL